MLEERKIKAAVVLRARLPETVRTELKMPSNVEVFSFFRTLIKSLKVWKRMINNEIEKRVGCVTPTAPVLIRWNEKMMTSMEVKLFIRTEDSASWSSFFILYLSTSWPVYLALFCRYRTCRLVLDTGWRRIKEAMAVLVRLRVVPKRKLLK